MTMSMLAQIHDHITTVQKTNKANWKRHKKTMLTIMGAVRDQLNDGDEICMCPTTGSFLPFDTDSDGYARFGPNTVLGDKTPTVYGNFRVTINIGDISCMVVIPISYQDSMQSSPRSISVGVEGSGSFIVGEHGIPIIVAHVLGSVDDAITSHYNTKSKVHWYGL